MYRPIPGLSGYLADSAGGIWSRWKSGGRWHWRCLTNRWHRLKEVRHSKGYRLVRPLCGGRCKTAHVHRLILLAFVGPCPPGMECRHLNGDRTDNHLENICWGTHAENEADRIRHGHAAKKLTADQARRIRHLAAQGNMTLAAIGALFGVASGTASAIHTGRCWAHLDAPAEQFRHGSETPAAAS